MDIFKGLYEEFSWFIWGLLGIGLIWFFMGGIYSPEAHEGAYLKPPAPLDTGEAYGKYYEGDLNGKKTTLNLPQLPGNIVRKVASTFLEDSKEAEKIHATSLLAKNLYFDGIAGAKETSPSEEYVRILSSEHAGKAIKLTGLVLEGRVNGIALSIPKAANLVTIGGSQKLDDISLPPGGRALITTARSPIGESFRANMCTGYLDQFQNYSPDLRKECPSPEEEIAKSELSGEKACVDFVKTLPRCRIYQGKFPADISSSCKVFVNESLNYNSCAANHKNDKEFYSNEWRVFLDRTSEAWANKSEIIKLLDTKGAVVDAIAY